MALELSHGSTLPDLPLLHRVTTHRPVLVTLHSAYSFVTIQNRAFHKHVTTDGMP
jgi:hypothetical protein